MIKLISKGSIDECILQLGQKKLKLEHDMTAAEQGKQIHTHTEDKCSYSRKVIIIAVTCDAESALRLCARVKKTLPAET